MIKWIARRLGFVPIDIEGEWQRLLAAQQSGRTVALHEHAATLKPLNAKLEALENDRRFLAVENEALKARVAVQALDLGLRGSWDDRRREIEELYEASEEARHATRH